MNRRGTIRRALADLAGAVALFVLLFAALFIAHGFGG
jgi:hypothetical protein